MLGYCQLQPSEDSRRKNFHIISSFAMLLSSPLSLLEQLLVLRRSKYQGLLGPREPGPSGLKPVGSRGLQIRRPIVDDINPASHSIYIYVYMYIYMYICIYTILP